MLRQMTSRPSVWCSNYYFFLIITCKIHCKYGFNFFNEFTKMKIKSFERPNSIRNYKKKIMLGTSDTWSMINLSQQTSEPSYYILDWRILSCVNSPCSDWRCVRSLEKTAGLLFTKKFRFQWYLMYLQTWAERNTF